MSLFMSILCTRNLITRKLGLGKKYWGRHFWAVGYGVWSTGNITDEMVQEYLEHHKDRPNSPQGNWILEE